MPNNYDTICALATTTGGALSIIRISGCDSLEIAQRICSKKIDSAPANTIHHCKIVSNGEAIDDVMVSIFRAPHSYTGENSVEITCHGSSYIVKEILRLLVDNGCRMAQPGEYTQRAFLNGKLDLSQAEAVADLIASTNKATHQMAMAQLKGNVSTKLSELREQLLHLTSMLELELDFSDHEELEFADRDELLQLTQQINQHIQHLADTFEQGKAMKEGVPVAIVGQTNVGKSTLLNTLLNDDRAIVSNIHGTTRDTIEECIDINGVTFRFIDTAGIRTTTDTIEQIGIDRTFQAIDKSGIIIWLLDQQPLPEEIEQIKALAKNKHVLLVVNKIDFHTHQDIALLLLGLEDIPIVQISAKQRINIEQLEQAIYQAANLPDLTANDVIISNARHYEALCRAHESVENVLQGMNDGLSGDLLSEDLRQTLSILAEITGGQITTDEVLGNIFSHFCVGK